MEESFRRVAILGTGLIGGSFALALHKYVPGAIVAGWDREHVLGQARDRGAIDEGYSELPPAVAGADLIYVALPVGITIELMPQLARLVSPQALVTDASSTKRAVCAAAAECFSTSGSCFLGGHPMAGKEVSGIAAAEAELFRGSKYALIRKPTRQATAPGSPAGGLDDPRITKFDALLKKLGAEPVWLDAETHDRAAAIVSHLPQLLAVALAEVVRDQTDGTGLPLTLAGRGLRDALRLAGSPYSIWRDIILTNSDNLERALDQLIQSLEKLRGDLHTGALKEKFAAAGELYKILHDMR